MLKFDGFSRYIQSLKIQIYAPEQRLSLSIYTKETWGSTCNSVGLTTNLCQKPRNSNTSLELLM